MINGQKIEPHNQAQKESMLSPYRVLDLTDKKGLFCGQLLGSLGADVIKIEKPRGDPARNIGPFFYDTPDPEKSLFWAAFSANKRGITLDIETSDGLAIFKRLVKTADAVVESYPPGYMDRIGIGYSEMVKINPLIVMTSITPFGQTGPYKNYNASDLVCWALGGALFICGSDGLPPTRMSHVPQAYLCGGADAAWGTMMALYWRGITEEGQQVDISLQRSVELCAPISQVTYRLTGSPYLRNGNKYGVYPQRPDGLPHIWPIKDGYVHFIFFTGEFGMNLNKPFIEWMDSEGMADDYVKNIDWSSFEWEILPDKEIEHLGNMIYEFFATKTKEEVAEAAQVRRIMIQPIYGIREVAEHPQLKSRDFWQEVEYPDLGTTFKHPGGFCKPSDTTCRVIRRAPLIGEHNQEVYGEIGLSDEEIISLRQAGII